MSRLRLTLDANDYAVSIDIDGYEIARQLSLPGKPTLRLTAYIEERIGLSRHKLYTGEERKITRLINTYYLMNPNPESWRDHDLNLHVSVLDRGLDVLQPHASRVHLVPAEDRRQPAEVSRRQEVVRELLVIGLAASVKGFLEWVFHI